MQRTKSDMVTNMSTTADWLTIACPSMTDHESCIWHALEVRMSKSNFNFDE